VVSLVPTPWMGYRTLVRFGTNYPEWATPKEYVYPIVRKSGLCDTTIKL
jgi:hypothetical protein